MRQKAKAQALSLRRLTGPESEAVRIVLDGLASEHSRRAYERALANPKKPKSFAYDDNGTIEASLYLQGQIEDHCLPPHTSPPGIIMR
jgi:hypothetical protein